METKAKKTVYIVIGAYNSGSGTLTFPEDFDIDQTFESKEDAEARALHLNLETLEQLEETPPDDPTFENVLDLLRDMEDGGMVYDVHATDFFKKVNK